MPTLVDLENKTITASVRDLVEAAQGSGRGLGMMMRLRAELGRQVHQRYQAERGEEHPGFRAEAVLELTRVVDGFTAVLSGRADGMFEADGARVVEEAKSVSAMGREFQTQTPQDYPDFVQQLRLYGLCAAEAEPDKPVKLRLVLYSLLDKTRRTLDVPFSEEKVSAELDRRLRLAVEEAVADRERGKVRGKWSSQLRFPYPATRPHQQELIELIEKGLSSDRPVLAMAPTGIGKTVSALLPGLRESLSRNAQLFYATAKRTQNALAERTFDDILKASNIPKGRLKAVTLRAKEKMCPPGTLLCHPDLCPYLEGLFERTKKSGVLRELTEGVSRVSPEEIYDAGEKHKLCPFELSLMIAKLSDLIIGDYNYVYDPAVAAEGVVGSGGGRTLVIIDEAHNLVERAREYYSPFLDKRTLEKVLYDIEAGAYDPRSKEHAQPLLELGAVDSDPKLFEELGELIKVCLSIIGEARDRAREAPAGFSGGCAPASLSAEDWRLLSDEATRLLIEYILHNRRNRIYRPKDPVLTLCRTVRHIAELLAMKDDALVPYAAGDRAVQGEGVGITCVNPAPWLARRHEAALGTAGMSATLMPLDYYSDVLGFSAQAPITASVASPFPPENRKVLIIPTVDTTYRRRGRCYGEIARHIETVFGARRGNHIAFFPSFAFLEQVRSRLTLPERTLLIQKGEMDEPARAAVLDTLRAGGPPRLLLAVMGGVFAEGVDLPGEALVGAIVAGPGLPPIGFERDAMRAYFDERNERGFAYSMLYPGMRRVIQSAGRVIRTMEDKGVIVLLCRRFAEEQYARCLPPDWLDEGLRALVTEDPGAELAAFWKETAAK